MYLCNLNKGFFYTIYSIKCKIRNAFRNILIYLFKLSIYPPYFFKLSIYSLYFFFENKTNVLKFLFFAGKKIKFCPPLNFTSFFIILIIYCNESVQKTNATLISPANFSIYKMLLAPLSFGTTLQRECRLEEQIVEDH